MAALASTPPQSPLSDERLMALVQRDDARAFSMLYARHFASAVAVAQRYLRDPQAAEEVGQEVFFAVWRNRGRYRREYGSARTWLLSIAHNRAIDATRRARVRPQTTTTLEDLPHAAAPEDVPGEAERRDRARQLHGAVAALPRPQREVIALGYYGDLSQTEIARLTGAPLGTVKGRSRLAIAKLREQIAA